MLSQSTLHYITLHSGAFLRFFSHMHIFLWLYNVPPRQAFWSSRRPDSLAITHPCSHDLTLEEMGVYPGFVTSQGSIGHCLVTHSIFHWSRVLSTMPITRSYKVILADMNDVLESLHEELERVRYKKMWTF